MSPTTKSTNSAKGNWPTRLWLVVVVYLVWLAWLVYVAWVNVQSGNQ